MKVSLQWLNSYLDRPCDADEAEGALTCVGFPLDGRDEVLLPSGGNDILLDVEVTSNRGDCLSHLGLARELAASSGRVLQVPSLDLPTTSARTAAEVAAVDHDDTDLCPLYTARVLTDLKVGPSPDWLRDRLEAVGLRSVNNVVDVTNFVLLETGQPLHAFDLAKLHGRKIVVRRAQPNEPFVAIDGSQHQLAESMLVIADAKRAVAVAGVMGGLQTELSEATREILLESALFDPVSVRRTSRSLKLASDSSYRFERGVDPLGVDAGSRRAAALICQIAGGSVTEGVIRVGQDDPAPRPLSLRAERCRALLGMDISDDQQAEYLERLGLQPQSAGGTLTCIIPTYRRDLKREIDLIEEVTRLHGFDQLDLRPQIQIEVQPFQHEIAARQLAAQTLVAHGYHETITASFVSPRQGEAFLPVGSQAVLIADETRQVGKPMLRPSLIPSLLLCRKANQDLGNSGVRLFESASSWCRRDGRIHESRGLTIVRDAEGPEEDSGASGGALRELRGTIEELVERLGGTEGAAQLDFEPVEEAAFWSNAAIVRLGQERLGTMGSIAPAVLDLFGLKMPLVAAELDVESLLALYPPQRQVTELARFPGIERDLSIVVDRQVPWQRIERAVQQAQPAMLEKLVFLGTYRGKPIRSGLKSVSLRLVFRDPSATLRHEQVDRQVQAVIKALSKAVGAELRQ